MNLWLKELGLSDQTCIVLQSVDEGVMQRSLGDAQRQIELEGTESIKLLRLDAQDYVMVWEPSAEYEQFRSVGEEASYTAILGFGTDKYDPEFGLRLLHQTATYEIGPMAQSIWRALEFLEKDFAHSRIEPSRS
jgi:hypothetical protein